MNVTLEPTNGNNLICGVKLQLFQITACSNPANQIANIHDLAFNGKTIRNVPNDSKIPICDFHAQILMSEFNKIKTF